ncbi:MAG TPA: EAL domain-containing protein [Jatrophihabitans sp.]|nr:EAL domain-containing protein [Jatrophihabitans sp.]
MPATSAEARTDPDARGFAASFGTLLELADRRPVGFTARLRAGGGGRSGTAGRWLLGETCRRAAATGELGAIGAPPDQLGAPGFVEDVSAAVAEAELDPAGLLLAVPEPTLAEDVPATRRRLCAVKDLGVQLAVDGFGTGYTRLAHLRRFPIDALMVDRAVLDALSRAPASASLLQALVRLGRDLGLHVLASGEQ